MNKDKLFMRTIKSIEGLHDGSNEVLITFMDGARIRQYHSQDCCEYVRVAQVDGIIDKHIGATIYELQEKVSYKGDPGIKDLNEEEESVTYAFYTLKTSKGYLDWRWTGESNGYYSEDVECELDEHTKKNVNK